MLISPPIQSPPYVQTPNIQTTSVPNTTIISIKSSTSQPAIPTIPILPTLPLVPSSSVPPIITPPPLTIPTTSSAQQKIDQQNQQISAEIQAGAVQGTQGCPLGASSATTAAAAVSGEGTQVNLAAIPNLSKTPSTSGQPGGWKAIDCRLGAAAAETQVVNVLSQIDTSTPEAVADSTKDMSQTDKNTAAKGAGCGGRRSKAQGIYSGSVPASPTVQAEWDQKISNLSASGIVESDNLPPTNVTNDDWKIAVDGFMSKI
jgi:hypothetical protein